MDFKLEDWQVAAASALRKYLEAEVAPLVNEYEEAGSLPPPELFRKMHEFGLLGGLLPESEGGAGLNFVTYCTMLAEVSRVWPSLRSLITVSNLALTILAERGCQKLKNKYLAELIEGKKLAFFALTEPNVGSDASHVETRAQRVDDGWVLNGRKLYITNGTSGDVGVVFARTGGTVDKPEVSAFLVEKNMPGFTASRIRGMGMHSCPLGELLFENVHLPVHHLIGKEGRAFEIAKHYLNKGRCFVSFVCLGISETAYEAAVKYAVERRQFGRAIGQFQLIQQIIADMMTLLETSKLLAFHAATSLDNGDPDASRLCSMAKRHNSEATLRVCEMALQVHGGAGYTRDFPVERMYRDARHLTIAEGTNQIQALLLAQTVLGLSAMRG